MMRKTKIRIVGDPKLAVKVAAVVLANFEVSQHDIYNRAVGRDYAHSQAPGVTIYITIKRPKKEASP